MKLRKRFTPKQWYQLVFMAIVVVLFLIRLVCPSITKGKTVAEAGNAVASADLGNGNGANGTDDGANNNGSGANGSVNGANSNVNGTNGTGDGAFGVGDGAQNQGIDTLLGDIRASEDALRARYVLPADIRKGNAAAAHPIYSVNNFNLSFPDINDVQIIFAKRHGIRPQLTRQELEQQANKRMVYIGSNPYYHVEELKRSVPYLVPRAALLLQKIGRNFMDSLFLKHIPPAQLIVTSVTRSVEDVAKLQNYNRNASANSCHFYGTTFDISYTRYQPIPRPDGTNVRLARNDTLKWVLSEVLNDLRLQGACYVKYEVHQSCFHITVR